MQNILKSFELGVVFGRARAIAYFVIYDCMREVQIDFQYGCRYLDEDTRVQQVAKPARQFGHAMQISNHYHYSFP